MRALNTNILDEIFEVPMFINDNPKGPKLKGIGQMFRRCRNCKFWDNKDYSIPYAACLNEDLKAFTKTGHTIVTEPKFGCNQWETK